MRIYVASSWRNPRQIEVVAALKKEGHDVYDFRHPAPGNTGFSWSEIDPDWKTWGPRELKEGLEHPIAKAGFTLDMEALEEAEATVLVLPCGRSAHLELGYAVGAAQRTAVLLDHVSEPELMYRMVERLCTNIAELLDWTRAVESGELVREVRRG